MYIVIIIIIYLELKVLFSLYRKEVISYKSFSIVDYSKNLLFPRRSGKFINFLRIIFLIFVLRLFFDILLLIFNFYYITCEWFLKNLRFIIKIYTDNPFWIHFFDKVINFLRYFLLLVPLVNLRKRLQKKKMRLHTYVLERFMFKVIRFFLWRPNYWHLLTPSYYLICVIFIILAMFFSFLVDFILCPIVDIIEFVWFLFLDSILYVRILIYVRQYNEIAGVSYLRQGSSLFHISNMMQRHGFKAPKSSEFDKFRAKIEYGQYCRRYINSDMPPDYLDDEALDIYVFLLELFSDTRYELRTIPMIGFFFIIFPYSFLRHLAIFLYYLYIGLLYIFFFFFFPLVLIYVGLGIGYEFYKVLEFWHLLFFRDLDYLARVKTKIWDNIRRDAKREEENLLKKNYWRLRVENFTIKMKDFISKLKDFFK